jgi:hypothetical protein
VATRRTDNAQLICSNVCFEDDVVMLSAETTKSGKMAAVPFGPWAAQILQNRKAASERWRPDALSEWVFPSRQHGKLIPEARNILETLQEETGLWITVHELRRTMATEIGMEALMKQLTRLLVSSAALHHAQGQTGGVVVSGAAEGYLMCKASALRPLCVERENRLRKLVGLPVDGKAARRLVAPRCCCGKRWRIRSFSGLT